MFTYIIFVLFFRRRRMINRFTGVEVTPSIIALFQQGVDEVVEHRRVCSNSCPHTWGRPTVIDLYEARWELAWVKRRARKA